MHQKYPSTLQFLPWPPGKKNKKLSRYFHATLIGSGLLLLTIHSLQHPLNSPSWLSEGVAIAFTAILVQFSFSFPYSHFSELVPIQAIALGIAITNGPTNSGWAILIGLLIGYVWKNSANKKNRLPITTWLLCTGFALSIQLAPLLTASYFFSWNLPRLPGQAALPTPGAQFGFIILFTALQGLLFLLDLFFFAFEAPVFIHKRDLFKITIIELIPLPVVWTIMQTYPQSGNLVIALLSGLASILIIFMWGMDNARTETDSRQQEIESLNQISLALSTALDLDRLLEMIHTQVTQLLGIDSFYVALLDSEKENIWYPIAVKHGKRRNWPQRPMADRLTDRVIQERKPILLPHHAEDALEQIGLPPGENPIQAWLGVPLVASDQTIGCLAVFSNERNTELTVNNQKVLSAFSGPLSVAIQNALLYQQVQNRARQMETLSKISALITASLDSGEVFEQICRSAITMSNGTRSAIFLMDENREHIYLAHAQGFSTHFEQIQSSFSISNNEYSPCVTSGQPYLISAVQQTDFSPHIQKTLQQEGIDAFGDFPLISPDGQIGYLSVYFGQIHRFSNEEIDLLQTFAAQAALAVSNVRLYAQTDTALAQRVEQLTMLETVGRELTAATHSERLFDMILKYGMKFTNSQWGALRLWDKKKKSFSIRSTHNYPPAYLEENTQPLLVHKSLKNRQIINLGDISQEPDYIDFTNGQSQSLINVPLIHKERALGVITLQANRPQAYQEQDVAFITQLANQAAVAVINANLYRETQQRLQERSMLYQVGMHLTGTINVNVILDILLEAMSQAIPAICSGGYIWREDGHYQLITSILADQNTQPLPETIDMNKFPHLRQAMNKTGPLLLENATEVAFPFEIPNLQQTLIFPLGINAARQRLGFIYLQISAETKLEISDQQLLRALATQGSFALQNARLFADVRQGRDRLTALLNSVGEGVLMIQNDGCISLANRPLEALADMPMSMLINQTFDQLPPAVLKALGFTTQEAHRIVSQLGPTYFPTTPRLTYHFNLGGSEKIVERIAAPVSDEHGAIIGWVMVFHDVTEAHQLSQARDLITQTLVHDLRSPLSTVISAVHLLMDNTPPENQLSHQALTIAERSTGRVLDMVKSLMEISRMQAGKIELDLRVANLKIIIEQMIQDFTPQANESGVFLYHELPDELPLITLDASKIRRVIANLVDNALKFTPSGGKITARVKLTSSQMVQITVEDTGPGIPEEYQEKIFEQFSQVPGSRGRRRGSGLGLTFSQLAVEAHQGEIWVQNHPEGGSQFIFTLPIAGPT